MQASTNPVTESRIMGITGMTCNNCVNHVQKALRGVPGVKSAVVNLKKETVHVQVDPGVPRDSLVAAVRHAGYDVRASDPEAKARGSWAFWRR